jgi:hypothetical protein
MHSLINEDSSCSIDYTREHQICELIVKIQLRLETALDRLLDCQKKQASLLRLERMDIRADLTMSQNIPIGQTRLRLQRKIHEKTRKSFVHDGSLATDFDVEAEKERLEDEAQGLRREIDVLKSKAEMWKLQLNI